MQFLGLISERYLQEIQIKDHRYISLQIMKVLHHQVLYNNNSNNQRD